MRASPAATPEFVAVDSGNGTKPAERGGAVPEPGTVVSMGLLGAGVLGLVIRSRRRVSNDSLPIRRFINHLMHSTQSCLRWFFALRWQEADQRLAMYPCSQLSVDSSVECELTIVNTTT